MQPYAKRQDVLPLRPSIYGFRRQMRILQNNRRNRLPLCGMMTFMFQVMWMGIAAISHRMNMSRRERAFSFVLARSMDMATTGLLIKTRRYRPARSLGFNSATGSLVLMGVATLLHFAGFLLHMGALTSISELMRVLLWSYP